MIDRTALAEFLRARRGALQPEDVGLPRGARRRTSGLRREEVAALCHMSVDYYARLERERGPQPSEQMLASIALGLHLSHRERDHLFHLAGHHPPTRGADGEHLSPGLLRVLDRLDDTPAEIITELGETLRQTRLGVALTGDLASRRGPGRSLGYRWFTEPSARALYAPEEHAFMSRLFTSGLREIRALRGRTRRPPGSATCCSSGARSSGRCGRPRRSASVPARPSTSSTRRSGPWSCTASGSSTPTRRTP